MHRTAVSVLGLWFFLVSCRDLSSAYCTPRRKYRYAWFPHTILVRIPPLCAPWLLRLSSEIQMTGFGGTTQVADEEKALKMKPVRV